MAIDGGGVSGLAMSLVKVIRDFGSLILELLVQNLGTFFGLGCVDVVFCIPDMESVQAMKVLSLDEIS